jgi:hypothetical protein
VFIDEPKDVFGVKPICRVLGIAPSTYYAVKARERAPSDRASSVFLAASPEVEGVSGRYFEDANEARIVDRRGAGFDGVAAYALDRALRAGGDREFRRRPQSPVGCVLDDGDRYVIAGTELGDKLRAHNPGAENDDPPRVTHVPRPRSTRGVSGRRLAMSTGAHAMQVPSDARHFLRASRSIMEIMLGFDSVVITWPIRPTKRRSCTWRSIASAKSMRAVNRPGPRASVSE